MIIVVGGGPAGMSAALSAADAHSRVILIDSAPRLGGQYWRHSSGDQLDLRGSTLVSAVSSHPNIEVLSGARIWRADYRDGESTLQVLIFGKSRELVTKKLILATGAYDRTLPFPGWDIPGVMTPGAAQALLKGSGTIAGKGIVIAGTGPFLLPVATGLAESGANVVGLYEANRRSLWYKHIGTLARNMSKVRLALFYQRQLKKHNLRLLEGHAVIEAHKNEKGVLTSVKVAKVDKEFRVQKKSEFIIECDVLAIAWGFTSDLSLAGNLGVQCRKSEDGSIYVEVDEFQATSAPGIFAAGEITGIGGAELAQAEGTIAGLSAVGISRDRGALNRLRNRQQKLADAIRDAYPVGKYWTEWLTGPTVICRCEEVSLSDINSAIEELGATEPRSAKLLTRAGMGLCQGRICSRTFSEIVELETGCRLSDESSIKFAHRPIVTPITFEELAES
jgi:NADPH-dependent 2,4-dienoyl-CoA reductase/sulfur reductase-like enzyme